MILTKNPNIEIRKSIVHGWGVFTTSDIPKDTLLEECHGLFLSKEEFKKCDNIPGIVCNSFNIKERIMIPYGYGAIYNSRKDNTVAIKFNIDNQILSFITIKNIKANEELFLNYELARSMYKNKNIELE